MSPAETLSETSRGKRSSGGAAGFARTLLSVAGKDLVGEVRSREAVGGMLVFAVLTLLILHFALEHEGSPAAAMVAGILWLALAFAGTVGLDRSMASERDQACLEGLLLAPVDRSAIFFGKALANLVFMLLVAAILLPLTSVLFDVSLLVPGLLGVVVLGSVGYVTVGTLLAAMAFQVRARHTLLPILLFPLVIPVLLAAIRASLGFLEGLPASDIWPWVNLLIAFDVIFGAASWIAFDYVGES